MTVTIRDLAKLAGVTHSTVSKALNNEPGVSEETRKKIMKLANQLNYIPNLAAKRLAQGKTNTIGLIWPNWEGQFFYHLSASIQKEAAKRGYDVILTMADIAHGMKIFNQQFVDSIICWLWPAWTPDFEFVREAERFSGSLLFMGGASRRQEGHSLLIDRRKGIYEAVSHLASLGHRRIAFLGSQQDKLAGFMQGIAEFRLDYRPYYFIDSTEPDNEKRIAELLKSEDKPTAIVSDSQYATFILMQMLRKCAVKVPDDLSVIVYDDIPEMGMFEVPMTSIGPSIRQLSERALQILTEPGKEGETKLVSEELEPNITIRESVRAIVPAAN
ncbi:MAG: hypothetical protein K0Q59_2320 [Paenibacillus sp.]|jgi:LacI family transcriptional regulator|nr:hypothetical protein [Paenibacillus sp.]